MNPLLEQFLQEARENLKFIEQHLEELEGADKELLNSIFRAAHTLKGGSGIVGFEAVKNITHRAEDLLDLLRSDKLEFSPKMLDCLYDAFDEVLNLIEAAEANDDVIEGDPETQKRIVSNLLDAMGKTEEQNTFELPFTPLSDSTMVVNKSMPFLQNFSHKLPLQYAAIDADNLHDPRLYGIVFDVTQDCMIFGNDPVYVLSLLEDSLLGIEFAIPTDEAKNLLESEAEDEDDLLMLRSTITAFVYGNFEKIEEALYNFIDDILILPLDVTTLMGVTTGESISAEFFKDLSQQLHQAGSDVAQILKAIDGSFDVINHSSNEARKLRRFQTLLPLMETTDIQTALELLNFLPTQESAPTASSPSVAVTTSTDFTEGDQKVARDLLVQQLNRLRSVHEEGTLERAINIVSRCAGAVGLDIGSDPDRPQLIAKLEELLEGKKPTATISQNQSGTSTATPTQPNAPAAKTQTTPQTADKESKKEVIGKVVKVKQESIDQLMSVVGELLVAKNSLPYLAESVVKMDTEEIRRAVLEKYSFINRLTNQLQDLIMSMRMLPISYVFDRYPKLVRDISRKLDKKVKLTQEGGETKLDKNMIEMLADPLIHIVRNSLDHGIESPEDRKAKGKGEEGIVTMKAYPQSDKVIIEIHDDGKGIDGDRVVQKVLEKGLLPLEKVEAMSAQEKVGLITLAGLSTAEQISEYSGRGVGMDVVKKSLEEFGGNLDIKSEVNKGTKITLSIPVSLAVTTLLHVSMSGNHYGFPMEYVSETVKMEKETLTHLNGEPFIYIREQVIPLLFIEKMLDHSQMEGEPLSIVVLNIKGNYLAVVVNELLGQLDVVQKPMEGILSSHPILSGTALLGNGQIIMILDPYGLLSVHEALKEKETESEKEEACQ